jgi:hypothetical protein
MTEVVNDFMPQDQEWCKRGKGMFIPDAAWEKIKDQVAQKLSQWLSAVCTGRPIFVSDNPAHDWQWIAGMYDRAGMKNPFGHSGRRISDFWAGLNQDWGNTQRWKSLRRTKHDHHPVNDAMGNLEAFVQIMNMISEGKLSD